MDPARQLAQLLDGELGLLAGLADQPERPLGVRLEARLGEPERDGHGDHPLLSPVVQVALDPPALGVGGRDDPLPGVAEVVHALAQRACAPMLGRLAREADLAHPPRLSVVSAGGSGEAERAHDASQPLGRGEHDGAQDDVAAVGGARGDQLDAGHCR